jgi:lipid-A-disaccharide synthase
MVAGEPSGDRHGAKLAEALCRICPQVRIAGMGGSDMAAAGVSLTVDMAALSVVGLTEVVGHLGAAFRARRALLDQIDREPPQLAILIDFPDFNLWLARALKRRGVPLLYYISPQVWAWRAKRLRLMARILDRVAVILPFEEALLRRAGIEAKYVGHPLVEEIERPSSAAARATLGLPNNDATVLGLLPGSRPREVERLLPVMLEGARLVQGGIRNLQPVVALSPMVPAARVAPLVERAGTPARVVVGDVHNVIAASHVVVAASGSVTLEAALLETPMVVVYRTSWLSYLMGRLLIKVKHIALVNILAGRGLVPELVQRRLSPRSICDQVSSLLGDEQARRTMAGALRTIGATLGVQSASRATAQIALEMIDRSFREVG